MAIVTRVRLLLTAYLAVAVLLTPAAVSTDSAAVSAQDRKKKAPRKRVKKRASKKVAGDRPVAVINVASANRMLQDVEATFKSAEKPQIYELIKGFLGNVNDLKGIDRDKPFGVMLFVTAGIPPSITPVGFVPVKDMNAVLKMFANGPFRAKKVAEKKNRYEIEGPGDTLYVAVHGEYAYVSNNEASLDVTFPDPTKLAAALAKRYDISASVNFNAVSDVSRKLFAVYLRTSAEGELQQRDGEPEMTYRARRARGMRDIEWVEALLLHCETIKIGLDASAEKKTIVLEAALEARGKSKLAKMVKQIGARRSYFDNLLSQKVPLSASISWGLTKYDAKVLAESFNFLGGRMSYILDPPKVKQPGKDNGESKEAASKTQKTESKKPAPKKIDFSKMTREERRQYFRERNREQRRRRRERMRQVRQFPKDSAVAKVVESLIATAEKKHADFFLQFVGEPPAKFTLLAGAQVRDGRRMAAGLVDLFKQIQQMKGAGVPKITINAETHKGIAFHRIHFDRTPQQMERFFGKSPSLLLGASSRAVWVAVGGKSAFGELRAAIDKVIENKNIGRKRAAAAPLKIVVNVAQWVAMAGEGDGNPRSGREIARKAFAKGGDSIRVEVRTTENGLRARVQFDEGFLKFIGLSIANQYERRRGL